MVYIGNRFVMVRIQKYMYIRQSQRLDGLAGLMAVCNASFNNDGKDRP